MTAEAYDAAKNKEGFNPSGIVFSKQVTPVEYMMLNAAARNMCTKNYHYHKIATADQNTDNITGAQYKVLPEGEKKDYKYVSGNTILGTPTVEGLIGVKYNTIFLNDKFLKESKNILDYMDTNTPLIYIANGNPITMYGVMTEFDKLTNNPSLSRFKGLGELEAFQFKEAVMDPQTERTFIQYTIDSAMEEIEAVRAYEANKSKILDHVGNVSRLDLME